MAVAEITGSESFVHVDFAGLRWVALVPGSASSLDDEITVRLSPERFLVFNLSGELACAPDTKQAA